MSCCVWGILNCITAIRKGGCCCGGTGGRGMNSGKIKRVIIFDEHYASFMDITSNLVDKYTLLHKHISGLFGLKTGDKPMMEIEYVFNRKKYKIIYNINLERTNPDYMYFPVYVGGGGGEESGALVFNDIFFSITYAGVDLIDNYNMYQGPNNNFHMDKTSGIKNLTWEEFIILSGQHIILGEDTIKIENNNLDEFEIDIIEPITITNQLN